MEYQFNRHSKQFLKSKDYLDINNELTINHLYYFQISIKWDVIQIIFYHKIQTNLNNNF